MGYWKTRIIYAILALIILEGCSLISGSHSTDRELWRRDLHYLATELPARHVNLFFKVTQGEFDRAVTKLDKAIPSLRDYEIVVGMKRILAMIGDPHTDLEVSFSLYPLRLRWFKDGYFVTETTSAYRQILGLRLVQIGNLDTEKAYSLVSTVISHDNEYGGRAEGALFLVSPAILYALKILAPTGTGQFVFEDSNKNRFSVNFTI